MTHSDLLDRYAQLIVRSGVNVAPGQELVMTAPVDAIPLVRLITEHAYKAGASLVTTLYGDDAATLARFKHAPDESFDKSTGWLFDGMANAFKAGSARLAIIGEDPSLLAGQDTDKVARANRARSKAYRPALELITSHAINWCVAAAATPAWARSVFPDKTPAAALDALWRTIFACSRADTADSEQAWVEHSRYLRQRTDFLNARRYAALRYKGPGTDLTIGLVDGHVWKGGTSVSKNGVASNANIPTEEVFTMPHKDRVEGTVAATKPLSYQGTFIEGIKVRFEKGRIVAAHADRGADVFSKMISTDEGAARLGEVALVPHSSPIAKSGIVFNNTLFDENAASHVAVGQSYSDTMANGSSLGKEALVQAGANQSLIHVDWMIGSGQLDIDGMRSDGTAEPLMRQGDWAA
jgi:aminopeptidase